MIDRRTGCAPVRRSREPAPSWILVLRGLRPGAFPTFTIAVMILLTGGGSTVRAAEATLYERIALGPLVILGRCAMEGRRAPIDVVEIIKGSYAEPRLFVTYRSDNYNRAPGSPKIEFEVGQRTILVLLPEVDEDGRVKAPNRFILANGAKGKIDLPAEGADAWIEAVRKIASIQSIKDQNEVWEAHRALLNDPNPLLARTGFQEVLKFRLGNERLVGPLLNHLSGPRPEFRALALQVIGQIFASARRREAAAPSEEELVRETLARANADEVVEVRAEAVRSLRETGRGDLEESYRSLAARDPSQTVRYEAEVALLELRSSRKAGSDAGKPH